MCAQLGAGPTTRRQQMRNRIPERRHAALARFGARGVTQILPSTARSVLRTLASMDHDFRYIDEGVFERFEPDDLHDPALNILIACYLTATYQAMYDGRTDLVISAWNAGPGAV